MSRHDQPLMQSVHGHTSLGKSVPRTISGNASHNLENVINAFDSAFKHGEFRFGDLAEKMETIHDLLGRGATPPGDHDSPKLWSSPFSPGVIRLAIDASCCVYGITHDGIEKALLEFQDPESARVVDSNPGSFWKNLKTWALLTSNACTVFAICGSTPLDHVINLNCDEVPFKIGLDAPAFNAHSGMAICANSLLPILLQTLIKHRKHVRPVLVLAGHSAGGGVASLLYELVLNTPELAAFREGYSQIHCITFASAAVMSTCGNTTSSPEHLHISFINLDDPVPRMDLAYAMWVAKALAEVYNVENSDDEESSILAAARVGPLPPQSLRPGGELVLFTNRAAGVITPAYLQESLFVTSGKHDKTRYAQRLESAGLL